MGHLVPPPPDCTEQDLQKYVRYHTRLRGFTLFLIAASAFAAGCIICLA